MVRKRYNEIIKDSSLKERKGLEEVDIKEKQFKY
jgi:hypothetical protein